MIVIILIAALLLLVIVASVIIANKLDNAAQVRALNQRKWAAQQQVRDIGQRTRAAIRAEALRRQQQGKP